MQSAVNKTYISKRQMALYQEQRKQLSVQTVEKQEAGLEEEKKVEVP